MATRKRTEVLTLTREEVVWALMMYGYPIGSSEKPDAETDHGHGELVSLCFTHETHESVHPKADPEPAPVSPVSTPPDPPSADPPIVAAKPPEPDIPF